MWSAHLGAFNLTRIWNIIIKCLRSPNIYRNRRRAAVNFSGFKNADNQLGQLIRGNQCFHKQNKSVDGSADYCWLQSVAWCWWKKKKKEITVFPCQVIVNYSSYLIVIQDLAIHLIKHILLSLEASIIMAQSSAVWYTSHTHICRWESLLSVLRPTVACSLAAEYIPLPSVWKPTTPFMWF